MTASPKKPSPGGLSKIALLALLVLCVAAVAAVVYLAFRPKDGSPEVILSVTEAASPADAGLPALNVVDTLETPDAEAVVGGRYKVRIADNAREGSSGIARIGGLVTFVPDTRRGDVAIIEITRLQRTTAQATLIERLSSEPAAPAASAGAPRDPRPPRESRPPRAEEGGMAGQVFRGTVDSLGREGDGVVRVNGKPVFVKGAELGQHVEFRVNSERDRFAFGEVIAVLPAPATPGPDAPPTGPVVAPPPAAAQPTPTPAEGDAPVAETDAAPAEAPEADAAAIPFEVDSVHEVTVTEKNRRTPDKDGVARIGGVVVFVPNSQPGDRVRIRIAQLHRRAASAEVLERLPAEDGEAP
jgi:predicted RNA-binding protein with TRAM domain